MSINVNVTANPITIKRGKMLSGPFNSKTEFDKRRLMRLGQVRQQSKDIAENIRNKVKTGQTTRLSRLEKEGEVQLQNWQAQKLLQLQNQYQEALENMGLGHKEATKVQEQEDLSLKQQKSKEDAAKERGRVAANKLQVDKNQKNINKSIPIQRKTMTRDVENARASSVASKRGRSSLNNSSTRPNHRSSVFNDSDGENRIPDLSDLTEEESDIRSPPFRTPISTHKVSTGQQTNDGFIGNKSAQTSAKVIRAEMDCVTGGFPQDTRISERIKRRQILNSERENNSSDEDIFAEQNQGDSNQIKSNCKCVHCPRNPSYQTQLPPKTSTRQSFISHEGEKCTCCCECGDPKQVGADKSQDYQPLTGDSPSKTDHRINSKISQNRTSLSRNYKSVETPQISSTKQLNQRSSSPIRNVPASIPIRPKITVRSSRLAPEITRRESQAGKVPYDHSTRYSKEVQGAPHYLNRIPDDELVFSPLGQSDEELVEKQRQRESDAKARGLAALEKQKLDREYRELLQKLPLLEAQERIGEIGQDLPKYHMDYERLGELNRKKQNRLENEFEQVFVRPSKPLLVTAQLPKDKTKVRDLRPELSKPKDDKAERVSDERVGELSSMLLKLKSHRNGLMKDIERTLSAETLQQLTRLLSDEEVQPSKRKREEEVVEPAKSKRGSDSSSSSTESPRKRPRRFKTLILQNTSTQTSPVVSRAQLQQGEGVSAPVPSAASSERRDDRDDMCEIVIKLSENNPEVIVNPTNMKNIRVMTEQPEVGGKGDRIRKSFISEKSQTTSKNDKRSQQSKHPNSWRSELSTNSQITNTTSYYDPPEYGSTKSKSPASARSTKTNSYHTTKQRSFNSTIVEPDGSKRIDPRLLRYIRKLLDMSRTNLDHLPVTSVSEVSTPGESVVEMPTNNPMAQLKNVMRYFQLQPEDIERELQSSSLTTDRSAMSKSKSSNESEEIEVKVQESQVSNRQAINEYADVAASCTRKISNLTAMIEQVRAEKRKILESSSSTSERENTTTSYLDLPAKKATSEKSSASSEVGNDEIDRRLFEIEGAQKSTHSLEALTPDDEELLNRLKRLLEVSAFKINASDIKKLDEAKRKEAKKREEEMRLIDERVQEERRRVEEKRLIDEREKLERKRLEEKRREDERKKLEDKRRFEQVDDTRTEEQVDFQPLLQVSRLPKFDTAPIDVDVSQNYKKRPPPSKGLQIFNGDSAPPHELSTIVEGDSQPSQRFDSSPKKSSMRSIDKSLVNESSASECSNKGNTSPTSAKKTSSDKSSEEADLESMETMLQSIGMEWAIPTLRKTREALAHQNSSDSSKLSEASKTVRDILSKISSTSSSEGGGMSLMSENASDVRELNEAKTSTPIQGARKEEMTRYGQPKFHTDSDVSSVREDDVGYGNKSKSS